MCFAVRAPYGAERRGIHRRPSPDRLGGSGFGRETPGTDRGIDASDRCPGVPPHIARERPPAVAPRYQNPALAVDAVWIQRRRVLLVLRGRAPFRGRWALPGGFVELRETVEAAVTRELREETGLRARPAGLVGVYSGPDRDPRKPTTSVVFHIRGRGGTPRAGDDAGAARWIPLDEVGRLAFDHNRILRDALAQRRLRRQGSRSR